MTNPPAIKLENLTHIYNPGSIFEKVAVEDISLEVRQGEMVALIGHTGSGKSTLIQHLNALLKPTSGKIYIQGEDIHSDKKQLKDIRRRVGLVFQYPEHQLFESTVYKDVAFGPTRMGLSPADIDAQVKFALETVGLGKKDYDKSPYELSGGQKRRAAIAGVLAMRPQILVLDEPAAGLDPSGREEILSQIKHMHTALGLTVILVSHSMDDAARLSDRILVMNQGRLILDGSPVEVFARGDMLKDIGLDVPQISDLMLQINKTTPRIPTGAFSVDDAASALLAFAGIRVKSVKICEANFRTN